MAKHTPGPWFVGRDMTGTLRVYSGNTEIVRALSMHGARRLSAEERAANQKLIAALALLRAWVESTNLTDETGSMRPVYLAARALIAKHMEPNQ